MNMNSTAWRTVCTMASIACLLVASAAAADESPAFIPRLVNTSTIPANGDVNPYGVAFVPEGFPGGGLIRSGDVLVSNFNGSDNLQGTGTTIVQFRPEGVVEPAGSAETFFASALPGLSTALGVLRGGWVVVGNVSTTDGTFATIGAGALQVIDKNGNLIHTWTDSTFLDGPWDLAIDDEGAVAHLFVSNVLSGTISRLDVAVSATDVKLLHETLIAQGYTHMPNPSALVVGPTGMAYDEETGTLYVASTADNAIYAIHHANQLTSPVNLGTLIYTDDAHLRGPLALRFAPNGDLITTNGDAVNADIAHPSEMIEFTRHGEFVREFDVDPGQGGAFGFDTLPAWARGFNLTWVDDVTNTLTVAQESQRR